MRDRLVRDEQKQSVACDEKQQSLQSYDEALTALQEFSAFQQTHLKEKLERIVSAALKSIFEKDYWFVLDFSRRGTQSQVDFKIRDEYGNEFPLKEAHGGGLVVVVAFLMRVIIQLASRPQLRPIMLLDECFVQVSQEYRERLAMFLKDFVAQEGMQLILVTHEPSLALIGDKRYECRLVEGYTQVTELQ